jgi:hypothetical protein
MSAIDVDSHPSRSFLSADAARHERNRDHCPLAHRAGRGFRRCAHADAHYTEEQKAWFRSLHPHDRAEPCCDISDCREKLARIGTDGYEVYVDDSYGWVKVPPRAVLHGTRNPIGMAILCYQRARVAPRGLNLIIYCFVPADEG